MARALLGVRQVVPMHYGTFPVLTGTPEGLKKLVEPHGIDVLVLKPAKRRSKSRWVATLNGCPFSIRSTRMNLMRAADGTAIYLVH